MLEKKLHCTEKSWNSPDRLSGKLYLNLIGQLSGSRGGGLGDVRAIESGDAPVANWFPVTST